MQFGGVKEGDFIVAIGERDVKWASHDEVVTLIKNAGDSLSLKLVTPMDRNYLKVIRNEKTTNYSFSQCNLYFSQQNQTKVQYLRTAAVLECLVACQVLRDQWHSIITANA